MNKIKMLALASVAGFAAMPAGATTTMYTDSTAFLAASGGAVLNDLNGATVGEDVLAGSYPGVTISGTNATASFVDGASTYAVNGTTYLDVDIFAGSITAVFSAPLKSFGASFYSLNNYSPRTTITIDGTVFDPLPLSPSFLGFVSDTGFTSITFTNPLYYPDNDHFGVDDIYVSLAAPAVPEPATWGMMIAGLGIVGFAMRSRKAAVRFA